MTTYLLPCYSKEDGGCWIESVRARNFSEAREKFITIFTEDYDIDIPSDWDELINLMSCKAQTDIGDIYDIEEF